MSRVSELIRTTRVQLRMTQDALAEETGYSSAGIKKIEAGKVKDVRNKRKFIEVLQIDPEAWKSAEDIDRMDGLVGASSVSHIDRVPVQGQVPVVGRAAASGEPGKLIMLNEVTEYVPRPPELAGVNDGFAVFVYGDSMVPRYFAGEKVYVHPHRPIARGDFCVIQIGNPIPECAYVKRFVSMDDKKVRLEQYNPPKEITFPREEIHSMGRIVASGGF